MGLLALLLFVIAIASAAGLGSGPRRAETSSSEQSGTPSATTTSAAAAEHRSEGREGIPQPSEAGSAPTAPLAAARTFGEAWVNRPTSAAGLAEERRRLLSLSSGDLAARINFAFIRQGQGHGGNAESRGGVIAVERVGDHAAAGALDVLVTTKEQLTNGGAPSEPPHYSLYLARLAAVDGGYLLTDWEPQ